MSQFSIAVQIYGELTEEEIVHQLRTFRLLPPKDATRRLREASVAPGKDIDATAGQLCEYFKNADAMEWFDILKDVILRAFGAIRRSIKCSRTVAVLFKRTCQNLRRAKLASAADDLKESLALFISHVFVDLWKCAIDPTLHSSFPHFNKPSDLEAITTFAADIYSIGFIDAEEYSEMVLAVARCDINLDPVKYTFILLSRGIGNSGPRLSNDDMSELQSIMNDHFSQAQTVDNIFDISAEEEDLRILMSTLMDDAYKHPWTDYCTLTFYHTVDPTLPSCYQMLGLQQLGFP